MRKNGWIFPLAVLLSACVYRPSATPIASNGDVRSTPTVLSSTLTPTSDLFNGSPSADDLHILYFGAGTCSAYSVASSGGPKPITANPPTNCEHPQFSPDGTIVSYISSASHNSVYRMKPDGSDASRILEVSNYKGLPRPIRSLRWSPDGQKFALLIDSTWDENGTPIVWDRAAYLNATASDGSADLLLMSTDEFDPSLWDSLAWSPNGEWIFGIANVQLNPASDTSPHPVAYHVADHALGPVFSVYDLFVAPYTPMHFDWSPDSRSLAYVFPQKPALVSPSSPFQQSYLVISTLNGKEKPTEEYAPLEGFGSGWKGNFIWSPSFGARWSPDGGSFLLYNIKSRILVIYNRASKATTTVAPLTEEPLFAEWSPDGKWILIVTPEHLLEIVHTDGSDLRLLAKDVDPESVIWGK